MDVIVAEPHFTAEAKQRQREHGGTAPGRKTVVAKLPQVKGKARDEAAATLQVSPRYVSQAKKLKKENADREKIAFALRKENPKKNTQAVVAARLGVGQQTVSDWFGQRGTNTGPGNTSKPDARVKIPPKLRRFQLYPLPQSPHRAGSSSHGRLRSDMPRSVDSLNHSGEAKDGVEKFL